MVSARNEPKARLLAGVAVGVLMAAGSAAAQASPPSAPASTEAARTNATDVQEVVVTANKREERIHDVALSVSAVRRGVTTRRGEIVGLYKTRLRVIANPRESGGKQSILLPSGPRKRWIASPRFRMGSQ